MDLKTCLRAANWRTLCAIAATHHLRLEPHPTKARLVEALSGALSKRVTSSAFSAGLSPAEQALLAALAASGGCLQLAEVAAAYGPLRPLSGTGESDPRRLARDPASTLEALLFRGVVYVVPDAARADVVSLPDAWLPLFRPAPTAPTRVTAGEIANPWADISFAMAVYLAALQSSPAGLTDDGRLGASAVKRLAALLHIPLSERAVERQIRPLACLRYVGERLNLLQVDRGMLAPSPAAATWLETSAAMRVSGIWQALLADTPDNDALWRQYRLPGRRLKRPILFAQRLVARITAHIDAASDWLAVDDLVPTADDPLLLADLLPWWESEQQPAPARETAWNLLSGPFAWIGAVQVSLAPLPMVRLTALGRWLMGQGLAPVDPQPRPVSLDVTGRKRDSDPFLLRLPPTPALPALLALADWADPVPTAPDDPALLKFELSPASVGRAIGSGARPDDLLHLLMRAAQPQAPLLDEIARAALRWAAPVQSFTVRPLWVLTAPSPAHLDAILDRRALRRRLGRRLSPTEVELDPLQIEGLLSALRQQHVQVAFDGAGPGPSANAPTGRRSAADLAPADLTWLLTALPAYAHLAHRLHLPPPPEAVADRLTAWADAKTRDIAASAADLASRRLDRALADLDPALAPIPAETLLPVLHDAVEREAVMTIRYWTPSRPLPVSREVAPRRIEWHGDTPYLVAYCHLQMDERTFRLDRIIEIDPPTQS